MERMKKHALQFDVQIINDHINSVELSKNLLNYMEILNINVIL